MKFAYIITVLLTLLTCSTQRKNNSKDIPTFHPKTYYNQYRPKFSPFETHEMPTMQNDRGQQYKIKPKPKND